MQRFNKDKWESIKTFWLPGPEPPPFVFHLPLSSLLPPTVFVWTEFNYFSHSHYSLTKIYELIIV